MFVLDLDVVDTTWRRWDGDMAPGPMISSQKPLTSFM